MDKKGIIDDILIEWAAECEDGMVGGHLTNNNIAALASVLEKRGLSKDEVLEIITPILDEAAKDSEEYDPEENDSDISKLGFKQDDEYPEDPNAPTPKEKSDEQKNIVKKLKNGVEEKEYSPEALSKAIYELLRKNINRPDVIEFVDKSFNTVKGSGHSAIEKACEEYNKLPDTIKEGLNKLHTGQKRSALGKGEIAFVWMIEGATHGGLETGDINLGGFKVDIKDYGSGEGGGISIERTSFDNFDLVLYIEELKRTLDIMASPGIKEYCLGLLKNHTEELDKFAKASGIKGANAARVTQYTENLISSKNIGKLNKNAKCGLDFISKKIDDATEREKDKIPTTMSVYKRGEKSQAIIDGGDLFTNEPIQKALSNIEPAGKEIAINVKPLDAETQKQEGTILNVLLKADYLRRPPQDKWTVEKIWFEMAKRLHYDGIILLTNNGNKVLNYVKKEEFATKLKFDSLGKAVTVKLVGDAGPKTDGMEE